MENTSNIQPPVFIFLPIWGFVQNQDDVIIHKHSAHFKWGVFNCNLTLGSCTFHTYFCVYFIGSIGMSSLVLNMWSSACWIILHSKLFPMKGPIYLVLCDTLIPGFSLFEVRSQIYHTVKEQIMIYTVHLYEVIYQNISFEYFLQLGVLIIWKKELSILFG